MKKQTERSEEVQDIIDRIPSHWVISTSIIVTLFVTTMLSFGFLIKYPDTIIGEITITTQFAPVRVVARNTGQIYLHCKNGKIVKQGEILAYINNGECFQDIERLDSILKHDINLHKSYNFPRNLILGNLGNSYLNFLQSYKKYQLLLNSKTYQNLRSSIQEQIKSDSMLANNLFHEMEIKSEILSVAKSRFEKDSILFQKGAISEEEYVTEYKNLKTIEETNIQLRRTYLSKLSEIKSNHIEYAKIEVEESEALQKALLSTESLFLQLTNNFSEWKEYSLITSPINGEVTYLDFWKDNIQINQGDELFSIIPNENQFVGEVYITLNGAGKIERGQRVNIKLYEFPYNEYGYIKGKIAAIGKQAKKYTTGNETTFIYPVEVNLPEGLKTNLKKELFVRNGAKGIAEIVTKEKKLIERLLDNLKSIKEK